jgi:hypothetical protein
VIFLRQFIITLFLIFLGILSYVGWSWWYRRRKFAHLQAAVAMEDVRYRSADMPTKFGWSVIQIEENKQQYIALRIQVISGPGFMHTPALHPQQQPHQHHQLHQSSVQGMMWSEPHKQFPSYSQQQPISFQMQPIQHQTHQSISPHSASSPIHPTIAQQAYMQQQELLPHHYSYGVLHNTQSTIPTSSSPEGVPSVATTLAGVSSSNIHPPTAAAAAAAPVRFGEAEQKGEEDSIPDVNLEGINAQF